MKIKNKKIKDFENALAEIGYSAKMFVSALIEISEACQNFRDKTQKMKNLIEKDGYLSNT